MSDYRIERFGPEHLEAFATVFEAAFGRKLDRGYFARKQDTEVFGAMHVGYMAYASDGAAAAYYGVFPCMVTFNGQQYLAAQSGDTMTHPDHQGKGLFTALAQHTYALCRELGIHLVFGFPNANSYPGFVRKLAWEHVNDLHAYVVQVRTLPWVRLKRMLKLPEAAHRAWCATVLGLCAKGGPFANPVLQDGVAGVDRSPAFFEYKTYEPKHVIRLHGIDVWVKVNDDFLLIGDLGRCDRRTFTKVVGSLKRLAACMGLHHLRYHCTEGAYFQAFFAESGREMETTYPVGGINFSHEIALSSFHFTMADNDGF